MTPMTRSREMTRSRDLMTRDEILACLDATERRLPPGAGALVVGPLLGAMLWALAAACWAALPWALAAACWAALPSLLAAWGAR